VPALSPMLLSHLTHTGSCPGNSVKGN